MSDAGEWRNWQTRSLEEAVPIKRGGGSSPLSPTKSRDVGIGRQAGLKILSPNWG